MKAAVLREIGQPLRIEDWPTPQPGPSQVLIKTRACGIDGTDLKLLDGFGYAPRLPFVMGHEVAGEVAALGADVSGFAPGDRALVYNFLICGSCRYCRLGRDQLCIGMRGIVGILGQPGGYAEYVCLPAQQLIRLPAGVAWVDGATCCDAGMTALHAVDRAGFGIGDHVLVIGIGGVGSIVTQILAAAGCQVIAVDRDASKADWAREQGAATFLPADSGDLAERIHQLTAGAGVDGALDVVGSADTMRSGFEALRPGGRMVVIGYTPDALELPGKELAQNEKEVIGTRAGRRHDLARCVGLYERGKLRSIVRRTYPLDRVNQALDELRAGARGRIVLRFD